MAQRVYQWLQGLLSSLVRLFQSETETQEIVTWPVVTSSSRPLSERVYSSENVGRDRPLDRPKFASEQWNLYEPNVDDTVSNRLCGGKHPNVNMTCRRPKEDSISPETSASGECLILFENKPGKCHVEKSDSTEDQTTRNCYIPHTKQNEHNTESAESNKPLHSAVPDTENLEDEAWDERLDSFRSLNNFLLKMEEKSQTNLVSELNHKIYSNVTEMVERTFRRLSDLYPIFVDSMVHQVGSVGEGTKVGIFDEFDFMVELSALETLLLQEIKPNDRDNEPANCVTINNTHFFLDLMPSDKIIHTRLGGKDAFGTLKVLIKEELFSSLLPRWCPGPSMKVGDFEDKGKVRTIRLRYKPENVETNIDVFLDFSLCVPFDWTPERRTLFTRSATKSDLSSPNQRYRLLVRQTPFWVSTTALREKNKLVNSDLSSQYKRVYRLAKMLTKAMLPPFYDFTLDNLEGLLPSYWLKQIMLFMIDEFPEKSSWKYHSLGLQVCRLFERFDRCLEKSLISNYFSPMLNHVMDNTKSVERYTAQRYVPVLCSLLRKSLSGDNTAIESLCKLEHLTSVFKSIVSVKSRRMRLLLLLLRYKGLVTRNRHLTESTKFFSRVDNADTLYTELSNYLQVHVKSVTLAGRGTRLKITEDGKVYNLNDFIKLIRDDPLTFPDDWEELYDRLFREHMPSGTRQPGPTNDLHKSCIGSIIRKTFGERPKPLSAMDGFILTNEFVLK